MSTRVLTTTLAAVACAAVVAAQTPQAPAPPSQPAAPAQRAPEAKSAADNLTTVIGCVERRAESSTTPGTIGTTGTAGAVRAPAFILTKVMSPTAAAGSSSAAAATYQLDADDSKLTGHVGQKVEIRGALADRSASSAASKSSGDAPRLKVESVKMIASTCTE